MSDTTPSTDDIILRRHLSARDWEVYQRIKDGGEYNVSSLVELVQHLASRLVELSPPVPARVPDRELVFREVSYRLTPHGRGKGSDDPVLLGRAGGFAVYMRWNELYAVESGLSGRSY